MATPEEVLDYGDQPDETPDWVNEGDEDVDVGDLSAAPESDVLPTMRNVVFEIRKATLDTQEFKNEAGDKVWAKRNLHLQLNVGPEGAGEPKEDGTPRYVNKAFHTNLLLKVNRDDFPDAFKYDKYAPDGKAWTNTKTFYRAMGGDPKSVRITRQFRAELVGKLVKADIVKKAKRAQVEGVWTDQGFENVIENFRKVE
jgi:hypothetical protein